MKEIAAGIWAGVVSVLPIGPIMFITALVSDASLGESLVILFSWTFLSSVVALVLVSIYGAPIYWVLKRLRYANLVPLIFSGAAGGVAFSALALPAPGWEAYVIFGAIGSYCAAAFWYGAKNFNVNK